MKISLRRQKNTLTFIVPKELVGSSGIGQGGAEVSLVDNRFDIKLPSDFEMPHPDLIALACVSAFMPWIKEPVEFPYSVSKRFAKALYKSTGIEVLNISSNLLPRDSGKKIGISFSGGTDSVAVSCLLPKDSPKVTFIRMDHPSVPVREDNTKDTVIQTVSAFPNVTQVPSNLEYIVGPYLQFPAWTALSIPCILLADYLGLKSVAYGSIDGSSMVKNGGKFAKPESVHGFWGDLFKAAGLYMSKPVAGLSDIGTDKVVKSRGLQDRAMSCTLGTYQNPCMSCTKCLRKYIVGCAVDGVQPDNKILVDFLQHAAARKYLLSDYPIYFQHVFMYAFQQFNKPKLPKPYKIFYKKLFLEPIDMTWAEQYDQAAITLYTPMVATRKHVFKELDKILEPLSRDNIKILRAWNLYKVAKRKQNKLDRIQKKLEHELSKFDPNIPRISLRSKVKKFVKKTLKLLGVATLLGKNW